MRIPGYHILASIHSDRSVDVLYPFLNICNFTLHLGKCQPKLFSSFFKVFKDDWVLFVMMDFYYYVSLLKLYILKEEMWHNVI